MNSILSFDKMLTPFLIKFFYWIGLIFIVFAGIMAMLGGINQSAMGYELKGVFGGLLFIVVGGILLRISCELMILIFRIYDVLVDIKSRLEINNKHTVIPKDSSSEVKEPNN